MRRVDERNLPALPSAALYGYFEAASRLPVMLSDVATDAAQVTRLLSDTERATARITVGPPSDGSGLVHEAVARLRVWDERHVLDRLSFTAVARGLHVAMFSAHPRHLIHAAKAVYVLELADRLDLIEVWLSTPDPDDDRRWLRVRLCERMNEIRLNTDAKDEMSTFGKRTVRAAPSGSAVNFR